MSSSEIDLLKMFFGIKDYFDAMPRAWERAKAAAVLEVEAVCVLLAGMELGRRLRLAGIDGVAAGLPRYGLVAALGVLFATLRCYPDEKHAWGLGLNTAMWAGLQANDDSGRTVALHLHVFRLGLRLASGIPYRPVFSRAATHGVLPRLVLSRGWGRQIPWRGVSVGDGALSDAFAVALLDTVAPVATAGPRRGGARCTSEALPEKARLWRLGTPSGRRS